jgi:hypothetical protein
MSTAAQQSMPRPPAGPGARVDGPPPAAGPGYSREQLQHQVDQAAAFNLFAVPENGRGGCAVRRGGQVVGVRGAATVHRFQVELQPVSAANGVRAANRFGEPVGRMEFRWPVIPHEFFALPDREPPAAALDLSRSQRLALQETVIRFGDGADGFACFGAGRTYPMVVGGRLRLMAAGVANVAEGFGKFRGHEGNLTLCGELCPDRGFLGHVLVRIVDADGALRTRAERPPLEPRPDPAPGLTFLMWAAQKDPTPGQENRPSLGHDGQVRGMNVPVGLKCLELDFAVDKPDGFRCAEFSPGDAVGLEVGFGRGADPDAPPSGSADSPYLFGGVARYRFDDGQKRSVGALTTNVSEGRRIDVELAGVPGVTGWRFGFFGPVIYGSGYFRGARGLFYGASGSVFLPPPGYHVVTHLYAACLDDADGKFRAAAR